ncbi:hypothetical protein SBV1_900026 [Verrucomicrobia bacterium]|nr:hypothetical protein SBV1_900026 [Verrucomicrobiota bacterium]
MTNDEIRKNDEARMTNFASGRAKRPALSGAFGFRKRQPRTPKAFASGSVRGAQLGTLREAGCLGMSRQASILVEMRPETGIRFCATPDAEFR